MRRQLSLALCCYAVSIAAVSAQTIYSNISSTFPLGENDIYGGRPLFLATQFTATGAGNLATVTLSVRQNGSPGSVGIGLYTDSAAQPDSLLESWTISLPPLALFVPTTLFSLLNPLLYAGVQYWVVVQQTMPNEVQWLHNDTGVVGGIWAGNTLHSLTRDFADNTTPGIRLTATAAAIPEKGSTAPLLSIALAVLFVMQMTRRARCC